MAYASHNFLLTPVGNSESIDSSEAIPAIRNEVFNVPVKSAAKPASGGELIQPMPKIL
ncbi:MAG: hypothetical protein QXN24_06180 [Candidatus Bathyarchaeia archaeon]